MEDEDFQTYDFLINEEDEVMLLLYAKDEPPSNTPRIEIDIEEKTAYLARTANDIVVLKDISDEILDSLQETDKLLVCELNTTENEKDTKIVYAYEADITD